jgi:hypothetical protein
MFPLWANKHPDLSFQKNKSRTLLRIRLQDRMRKWQRPRSRKAHTSMVRLSCEPAASMNRPSLGFLVITALHGPVRFVTRSVLSHEDLFVFRHVGVCCHRAVRRHELRIVDSFGRFPSLRKGSSSPQGDQPKRLPDAKHRGSGRPSGRQNDVGSTLGE